MNAHTHVCGSVVFTTKTAHTCTKTPSPLYRLPGQQERNLAGGMLRIKETRRRKKRREGQKRRDKAPRTDQSIKTYSNAAARRKR